MGPRLASLAVLPFSKYHGLGNDFLILEGRHGQLPSAIMADRYRYTYTLRCYSLWFRIGLDPQAAYNRIRSADELNGLPVLLGYFSAGSSIFTPPRTMEFCLRISIQHWISVYGLGVGGASVGSISLGL